MWGSPWNCQETLYVLSSQDGTPSTASIPRYTHLLERKLSCISCCMLIVDLASFFQDNLAHFSVKELPVWLIQMFQQTNICDARACGVPPDRFNANKLLSAKLLEGNAPRIFGMHLMLEWNFNNLECPTATDTSKSCSANALPTLPKDNATETKHKYVLQVA